MTANSAPRPITPDEIDHRFTYHPPTDPRVREAHDHVRAEVRDLAHDLVAWLPPGREASLAVTALEEASMWCHAAIARNHGHFTASDAP